MSSINPLGNGEALQELPANRQQFYQQVEEQIKLVKPKLKGLTEGQKEYLDTINQSVITLCTGCAGTGKTYIAVIRALELLKERVFRKIVIARPAVPCGEELGHLPGNLDEKIAPYMRPIVDILEEFIGDAKEVREYITHDVIELCPLAYMRGRTLNDTMMILDEAQNAKWEQLVMFMTRIGRNSKIVISGDEDQKDRQDKAYKQCVAKWERPPFVDGVNVVRLNEHDIVRNSIIGKIIHKMGEYQEDYNHQWQR
jgi:phosphate starvation-inducible protein PhoH and related proteins